MIKKPNTLEDQERIHYVIARNAGLFLVEMKMTSEMITLRLKLLPHGADILP